MRKSDNEIQVGVKLEEGINSCHEHFGARLLVILLDSCYVYIRGTMDALNVV